MPETRSAINVSSTWPPATRRWGEPMEDRDVGAWPVRQMHIGDGSEFGASWINNDQPGALPNQPLQPCTDDGMCLCGIGANQQNAVGPVEVVKGVRAAGQPESGDEARRRWRVTQPGAVVDVVGADDCPHQLLQQIVLLVRRSSRGDSGYCVRSVLCDGAPQPLPDQCQGLVPRGTLQLAVAPYEWIGQPIAGAGEC